MLSPLELENKRILTNKRRYDRFEMDEYLDMVFENYKQLYSEYEEQKKQIKTLSEGIQYYRSIESTMQKALLLAEKTSKETKDAAILKAEAIEKDANNKAQQILGTAEQEYTRIREKCIELVTQFNNYKAQLQVAANEQLRLISSTTFDIDAPEIDKEDNISAAGLETVGAVGSTEAQPTKTETDDAFRQDVASAQPEPFAQPESFVQKAEEQSVPEITPPQTDEVRTAPVITEEKTKSNVYSYTATGNTNPLPDLSGLVEPEPVQQVQASTEIPKPEPQPEPVSAPVNEPISEPVVSAAAPAGEVIAPASTSAAGEIVAPINSEPEPDITSQFEMYTEAPAQISEVQPERVKEEPVSDKTMVLPDVKDVDKEALRSSRTYTEEEQLQILSAETINLNDSIKAVKEQEMLEVPKREEPEQLVLEQNESDVPLQAKPQTGLDTILQSMTIGKKKKANGESAEDPFEFLGSVDDF